MNKYRWVFIDELTGGGREFHVAGDGGHGEGFRVVRDDNALERDVCLEVFLFLHWPISCNKNNNGVITDVDVE